MKTIRLIHFCALFFSIVSLLLPYISEMTMGKLNNSSKIFEFADGWYETSFNGYETKFGQFNILIIALLELIFLFSKKISHAYFLIPIGLIYLTSQLFIFLISFAGFGAPKGNELLTGFALMFLCTIILFITCLIRLIMLHKESSNKILEDF
jgi:hypothetical protein